MKIPIWIKSEYVTYIGISTFHSGRCWTSYRLLASPHNAWATGEAIDTLVRCVARNIEAYLKK